MVVLPLTFTRAQRRRDGIDWPTLLALWDNGTLTIGSRKPRHTGAALTLAQLQASVLTTGTPSSFFIPPGIIRRSTPLLHNTGHLLKPLLGHATTVTRIEHRQSEARIRREMEGGRAGKQKQKQTRLDTIRLHAMGVIIL